MLSQAMTDIAEAEQISAARDGGEAAFERLVAAYRGPLHAHCRHDEYEQNALA